jgi:two-component system nitrate/nitrite response regulator NarL
MLKNAIVPDTFLQCLELVMSGQTVYPNEFIRILGAEWLLPETPAPTVTPPILDTSWEVQRVISQIGDAPAACRLSERETAILLRLMHGAANKVIARELDIAEATVKVHVKSVLRKIRVKNRTQAATWAWAHCSRQPALPEPAAADEFGAVNGKKRGDASEPPAAPGVTLGLASG